jgi:hypothetical protein
MSEIKRKIEQALRAPTTPGSGAAGRLHDVFKTIGKEADAAIGDLEKRVAALEKQLQDAANL